MADQHQVLVGDSLMVVRSMATASVDCVISDPPYRGMGFGGSVTKNWVRLHPYVAEMQRVSTGGRLALSQPLRWLTPYRALIDSSELLTIDDAFADGRGAPAHFLTVGALTADLPAAEAWSEDIVPPSTHANARSVRQMSVVVKAMTRRGDTVLDPFCGSAAIGVACLLLGRHYIGIEAAPERADDARRRLAAAADLLPRPSAG